jgi:hypothetical protein
MAHRTRVVHTSIMRPVLAAVLVLFAATGAGLLVVGSTTIDHAHFWPSTIASFAGMMLLLTGVGGIAQRRRWRLTRRPPR